MKNVTGILIGNTLNLDCFGNTDTLTLTLPIREHGTSLHLFVSSSIFFHQYIVFFGVQFILFLNILVQFISKYFITFGANVNGIAFVLSLSDGLLAYKNTRFLSIFNFSTLLHSLVSSKSFLVKY